MGVMPFSELSTRWDAHFKRNKAVFLFDSSLAPHDVEGICDLACDTLVTDPNEGAVVQPMGAGPQ